MIKAKYVLPLSSALESGIFFILDTQCRSSDGRSSSNKSTTCYYLEVRRASDSWSRRNNPKYYACRLYNSLSMDVAHLLKIFYWSINLGAFIRVGTTCKFFSLRITRWSRRSSFLQMPRSALVIGLRSWSHLSSSSSRPFFLPLHTNLSSSCLLKVQSSWMPLGLENLSFREGV